MADPTKPYELIFEERADYLYACVKAETINEESALSYLREVAERCALLESTHLMLYRDIPTMLPTASSFLSLPNSSQ